MFTVIVGGGMVGSYLANLFLEEGHQVRVLEKRADVAEKIRQETKAEVVEGDASDPTVLEQTGVQNADVFVAVSGHDEDNLVTCQLAKYTFKVPRVIARVNNPRNEWLYTRQWGVDVSVSQTHIIGQVIREESSLHDIVTLLKLRKGDFALVEAKAGPGSKIIGKPLREVAHFLPQDCIIVAAIRGEELIIPRGTAVLEAGDQVLAVAAPRVEKELEDVLCGGSCEG